MVNYDIFSRMKLSDGRLVQRIFKRDFDDEEKTMDLMLNRNKFQIDLDSPKIYEAIVKVPLGIRISPPFFFYVITRHQLKKHKIQSYAVAEYTASIMEAFLLKDRCYRISKFDEDHFEYLVDLRERAASMEGDKKFFILSHLGDYSLWSAGLFPEYIENKGLSIKYYDAMGKSGYKIAAMHPMARNTGADKVFEEMVDNYSTVRRSLNTLRETFLFSR